MVGEIMYGWTELLIYPQKMPTQPKAEHIAQAAEFVSFTMVRGMSAVGAALAAAARSSRGIDPEHVEAIGELMESLAELTGLLGGVRSEAELLENTQVARAA